MTSLGMGWGPTAGLRALVVLEAPGVLGMFSRISLKISLGPGQNARDGLRGAQTSGIIWRSPLKRPPLALRPRSISPAWTPVLPVTALGQNPPQSFPSAPPARGMDRSGFSRASLH